jgi:hypothetical protein
MQLDTSKIKDVVSSMHLFWDGILQVIGYIVLLSHFLGPAVKSGIILMILIIPINAYNLQR